jgi:L-2,4-diaminobutyric acid acetyltransferase
LEAKLFDMSNTAATLRSKSSPAGVTLDRPLVSHGAGIQHLVSECAPLDVNSTYAYLLLCEHFADTCVRASRADTAVGFISGYRVPERSEVLFVWQVAVAAEMRGQGLARAMLLNLLSRDGLKTCRYVETTVSPSNAPSRALFYSLAQVLQAPVVEETLFSETQFGNEKHETETLIRIGPFSGEHIK